MLPYLVAASIGALWASRSGPNVRSKRKTVLGPRTGVTYEVDDYEKTGLVMVKAKDGTVAVLDKKADHSGFTFHSGTGNPKVIELIKQDFLT